MDKKILFALLAVSIMVLVSTASVTAPAGARDEDRPIADYKFRVEIEGISVSNFLSVEGIVSETEAIEVRSGSDPNDVSYILGTTTAGPLVISGPLTENREIWDWYDQARNGKDVRRDITVVIMRPDGGVVRTITFFDSFPVKYSIPSIDSTQGEVLKWTLEVRVNRIDMA